MFGLRVYSNLISCDKILIKRNLQRKRCPWPTLSGQNPPLREARDSRQIPGVMDHGRLAVALDNLGL